MYQSDEPVLMRLSPRALLWGYEALIPDRHVTLELGELIDGAYEPTIVAGPPKLTCSGGCECNT